MEKQQINTYRKQLQHQEDKLNMTPYGITQKEYAIATPTDATQSEKKTENNTNSTNELLQTWQQWVRKNFYRECRNNIPIVTHISETQRNINLQWRIVEKEENIHQ